MTEENPNMPETNKQPKSRKALAIGVVAVLLLASAGLVFGRSIHFGEIMSRLTGNLAGSLAEKTNQTVLRTAPISKILTRKKTGQPSTAKVVPVSSLSVVKLTSATTLANGENDLIAFSLTADKPGSASVSKISFKTAGNVIPSQYTLYRNSILLMTSPTSSFTLPIAEPIAAGMTKNYKISGTVTNTVAGSYLSTTIGIGDITADQPISGLSISSEIGEKPMVAPPAPPTTMGTSTNLMPKK